MRALLISECDLHCQRIRGLQAGEDRQGPPLVCAPNLWPQGGQPLGAAPEPLGLTFIESLGLGSELEKWPGAALQQAELLGVLPAEGPESRTAAFHGAAVEPPAPPR